MKIDLEGKIAVVTGASRNIGKAVALALADAGADIALAARNAAQLEEVVELVQSKGSHALAIPTDVTDKDAVEKLMTITIERLGGVHILVNNVGTMSPAPILEITEEEWDRVFAVNLKSYFLCIQAAGRHMVKQRYGKIINMASTGGVIAGPNNASYHASKAAVIHFTKAVAIEWIRHNIYVNAIGPGTVDTPLADKFIQKGTRETMLKAVPIRRFADPVEIANLVVFLASDLSNYMVGEHVIIDGGLTIP